jgi:hypothetical protein
LTIVRMLKSKQDEWWRLWFVSLNDTQWFSYRFYLF